MAMQKLGLVLPDEKASVLFLVLYHIFETSRTIFALQLIVFEL